MTNLAQFYTQLSLPCGIPALVISMVCSLSAAIAQPVIVKTIGVDSDRMHLALDEFQSGQRLRLLECRPYQTLKSDGVVAWEGVAEHALSIPRYMNNQDRAFNRFQLVDLETGEAISAIRSVDDFSSLSTPKSRIVWPEDIKGVSCPVDFDDLVELGVKHVHINITPSGAFVAPSLAPRDAEFQWNVDGEEFAFNPNYIRQLDRQIGRMTRDGINVVAVVMLYLPTSPDVDDPLVNPRTDRKNASQFRGAFNLTGESGLRRFVAFMGFMAHRYSQHGGPNGIISGYIIGNEVDTHWQWHNMGLATIDELVEQHANELRVAYYAVRMQHPDIRVFTSLTHCWNVANLPDPKKSVPGRELLERLNEQIAEQGAFPWNLAFHPYPQDLFQSRFWNDNSATFDDDTPKVTMKNLEVLLDHFRQERFHYQGERRRVILSEQGFLAGSTPEDELAQAAAYALAYTRLQHLPGVDAFILHRHVDHRDEDGLKLGLWTAHPEARFPSHPDRKRPIWDVFQAAGTNRQQQAFAFALPIIGIDSWADASERHSQEWCFDHSPIAHAVS